MARYKHLSLGEIIEEMLVCSRRFYFLPRILGRVYLNFWQRRAPLISLVGNLSYRKNFHLDVTAFANFRHKLESRCNQKKPPAVF